MFRHVVSGPCFLCEFRSPVAPFPMRSAFPPRSTMERSDSPRPVRCPSFGLVHPTLVRETAGPPRFQAPLFLRATLSGPGRPFRILPLRSLCIGFRITNSVATCSCSVTRLNRFGECGLPCGPQDSLGTLRMHCSAIQGFAQSSPPRGGRGASIYLTSSVAYATLDTGGWLGLTRQGLAP